MNLWRWRRRARPLSELNREEIIASKASLEGSIDRLGSWMHGFTALVAIGLVIEYRDPLVCFFHTYDWKYLLGASGGIMVTIGVSGELLIGFWESAKDGKLRDANSVLQARLTELLTVSNERIAELNLKAEKERHSRLKLQLFLAGRDFTPEQSDFVRDRLLQFQGQIAFVVKGIDGGEPDRFAQRLWAVLMSCQWTVPPPSNIRPKTVIGAPGMQIFSTLDDSSTNAAKALASTLRELGIELYLYNRESHPSQFRDKPSWQEDFWPHGYFLPNDPRILIVVNDTPRPARPDVENA